MDPPSPMWGTTNLHVRNALVTLSFITRSKKASSISASGLRATSPPVTLTRISIVSPKASRVSRTRFSTSEAASVMSQRTAIARPPAASMAAAVALPSPELLHHVNTTFAPRPASVSETALPISREPPATIATLFSIFISIPKKTFT